MAMIQICSLVASSTTLTARYAQPCIHSYSHSFYSSLCLPFHSSSHLTDLTIPSLMSVSNLSFYLCFTWGLTSQSSLCVSGGLLHFIPYLYVQISITSFPHYDTLMFFVHLSLWHFIRSVYYVFHLTLLYYFQSPCQDRLKILAVTHRDVHSAHWSNNTYGCRQWLQSTYWISVLDWKYVSIHI